MRLIGKDEFEEFRRHRQAYEQLQQMGDSHAACENFQQARSCYRQAAVLAPDRPEPHISLGVVAVQSGQIERALRAFQTARNIDPQHAEAYSGMALVYQQQNRFPQAFEMYLKCLELNSDDMLALLGLFQASCEMGTFCKIIHYLELYLQGHPDDHSVLFCLASLYAREGRAIQARQTLLAVLAAEPGKPEAVELLRDVENQLAKNSTQEVA